ncbi:MAG: cytidylyltransferase domain-containing protein [bacterium]
MSGSKNEPLEKYRDSCLAVIPAREGSKRIPQKNLKKLHGKPMIAYTIEAALKSNIFSTVVVSTDSSEIKDVAEEYGAEVPFIRSPELADDMTPVSLATVDALEKVDPEGKQYGFIAQLMANCPLRTSDDIRDSFRSFLEKGADAQISVTRYGWLNPWWAMRLEDDERLTPLFAEKQKERSQDLGDLFCPIGAVWWAKSESLIRERTFHVNGRTGWVIPWYRAVDIDEEDDWALAEVLMA